MPAISAISAARVTCEDVVGMYEVLKEPLSSCAFVTDPDTVSINDPAVGVNVRPTRSLLPVPTKGPSVLTPDSVTVPVP